MSTQRKSPASLTASPTNSPPTSNTQLISPSVWNVPSSEKLTSNVLLPGGMLIWNVLSSNENADVNSSSAGAPGPQPTPGVSVPENEPWPASDACAADGARATESKPKRAVERQEPRKKRARAARIGAPPRRPLRPPAGSDYPTPAVTVSIFCPGRVPKPVFSLAAQESRSGLSPCDSVSNPVARGRPRVDDGARDGPSSYRQPVRDRGHSRLGREPRGDVCGNEPSSRDHPQCPDRIRGDQRTGCRRASSNLH